MTSAYTGLGVELMVTGENSGTWGDKTNANLNLIEQISGGFISQAVNGTGATTLAVVDGNTGAALATRSIKLTGTITGNITVTLPLDVENFYFIENATSGAHTVEFKYVTGSGSSVTWSATDKGTKIILAKADDVTNPNIVEAVVGGLPGGATTQVQFNNSGSFDGDANLTWTAGTALQIDAEKELRLGDASGAEYVGIKAPATVGSAYTLTMPAATGAADQILTTNGSGVLSFVDNSGGTDWQAVKTSGFTAVAGEGYFINTTGGAIEMDLPAGSIGDEISFIDYAGTFDTNALTIDPNGTEKIAGSTASLTVSVERAANTLVYTDGTQGWLLKSK
jgi:hypothetical protein